MLRRYATLALITFLSSCVTPADNREPHTSSRVSDPPPSLEREFRVCGPKLPGLECATMLVDKDRSTAVREPLAVLVGLLRSFNPDPVGAVFVNPGGPGASAVDFLSAASGSLSHVRQTHDIYAIDTRGTGGSSPINCKHDLATVYGIDVTPDSEKETERILSSEIDYVKSCEREGADIIGHMSSVDSANDMREVLDALEIERMNYLGFSYGSELGAVFASLFPERVGRFVFDGASDFRKTYIERSLEQGRGFERALNDYLARCDAASCFEQPAKDVLSRALLMIENGSVSHLGATTESGAFYMGLASMLYSPGSDDALTTGLREILNGDSAVVMEAFYEYLSRDADGSDDGSLDAFRAISTEDGQRLSEQEQLNLLGKAKEELPFFWPVFSQTVVRKDPWPDTGPPKRFTPSLPSGRVLYIAATGDPATTYQDTISLAKDLLAESLTRVGPGHTSYFFSTCVREQTLLFLNGESTTTSECVTDGH